MKNFNRFLKYIGLNEFITIKRNNYKIKYFNTSMSHLCYYNTDTYRIAEELFFSAYLKPGDTVIDVGANIGLLSLTSAFSVGNSGKVYSFEALPIIFKYLTKNVKVNNFKNVVPYNLAVGDKLGYVSFSSNHEDDTTNEVTIKGDVNVNMVTLDSVFNTIESDIDLLKIDVEGYEKFVLEGAKSILLKTKCIYFEVYEPNFNKYNYSTLDLLRNLFDSGFQIFEIEEKNIKVITLEYKSEKCIDLIAINPRFRKEFVERFNDSEYNILNKEI